MCPHFYYFGGFLSQAGHPNLEIIVQDPYRLPNVIYLSESKAQVTNTTYIKLNHHVQQKKSN